MERVTNEFALAILYEVVWPQNRDRLFESLLRLESVRNDEIPFGDWGVLNAWPLYDGFTPTIIKTEPTGRIWTVSMLARASSTTMTIGIIHSHAGGLQRGTGKRSCASRVRVASG